MASPQKTGQSGSSIDWTSTQWESDDDDDESENQPAFQQVRHVPSSPARQPQQHTQPVAAPRSQVIMSKPLANDGDDDSDDSEDMSEHGPMASTAPSSKVTWSRSKGQTVAERSRIIKHQLAGKDNQKRADAIDKKTAASSVRGSHATDTSNTYGTSVWGSSSKGGSTVPRAGSKERKSFVSVSDVSSDEELMRDIENI